MTLAVFHDFPGLENGFSKFHDFPGGVVTLQQGNGTLHTLPQHGTLHPLHEGLVSSWHPPSSQTECNQCHAAGVLGHT